MIDLPRPAPIFNPITAGETVTVLEFLAGPLGILAFAPLIPLLRWLAGRIGGEPAIVLCGAAWVGLTAGPWSLLVLSAWLALGVGWTGVIARLRGRGAVGVRGGVALAWVGLTALVLPFWWVSDWGWNGWTPSRLQVLHSLGPAYLYLRLLAWALDTATATTGGAAAPQTGGTLLTTAAWLAYPPAMRLGPLLSRSEFAARLRTWRPRDPLPWNLVLRRGMLGLIGAAALVVTLYNIPESRGGNDFFAAPQDYPTDVLLRVIINTPLAIYFFLWSYNEFAAAIALAIGIPVDNNFNWAPLATDIRDFWRRWHITVGAWLRQYIYLPLGGKNANPLLVFTVVFGFCALWHGPAWSFLAWGAAQALGMCVWVAWDRLAGGAGWTDRGRSIAWTTVSRVVTLSYQYLTVAMLVDFEHSGTRIFPELVRRAFS